MTHRQWVFLIAVFSSVTFAGSQAGAVRGRKGSGTGDRKMVKYEPEHVGKVFQHLTAQHEEPLNPHSHWNPNVLRDLPPQARDQIKTVLALVEHYVSEQGYGELTQGDRKVVLKRLSGLLDKVRNDPNHTVDIAAAVDATVGSLALRHKSLQKRRQNAQNRKAAEQSNIRRQLVVNTPTQAGFVDLNGNTVGPIKTYEKVVLDEESGETITPLRVFGGPATKNWITQNSRNMINLTEKPLVSMTAIVPVNPDQSKDIDHIDVDTNPVDDAKLLRGKRRNQFKPISDGEIPVHVKH